MRTAEQPYRTNIRYRVALPGEAAYVIHTGRGAKQAAIHDAKEARRIYGRSYMVYRVAEGEDSAQAWPEE